MNTENLSPDQLRQVAGASLQRWMFELGRRLSPDDAGRLGLAAAIAALEAAHGVEATADMLEEAAVRLRSLAGPVGHA